MVGADLLRRAHDYAQGRGLVLGERLGSGAHGIVFAAKYQSKSGRIAMKVHERQKAYVKERDAYLRLKEHAATLVRGCNVPELIGFDEQLWVIEMTMVDRPFVLDFAGAYLDEPPEFSQEVMADWRAEKVEQFGRRWPEVEAILRDLEDFGVFMADVNPGNISFGD
jgi:hypothetical protein